MAIKDIHEIVRLVKELNLDYGRPPLRQELESANVSRHVIQTHGFDKILAMAGLEPISRKELGEFKREKITNEIFKKSIYQVIEENPPSKVKSAEIKSTFLCIGDTHFPFTNKNGIKKVIEFAKIHQPDYIIQIGDLLDCYAASKFPRSQNVYTPKDEEELGIQMAREMWSDLRKVSPKSKCFQLLGNHDIRILKRTLESLPIAEHWIEKYLKDLFTFDGVATITDHREELEIEGIIFTHGFLGQGAHKDYYLKSCVHGHDHKLYVNHRRIHNQNIFELSCGFLGDVESKALSYTPSKMANYQEGFGWIDQWGPRTIHL
jgi:predicted phosphodiesterase